MTPEDLGENLDTAIRDLRSVFLALCDAAVDGRSYVPKVVEDSQQAAEALAKTIIAGFGLSPVAVHDLDALATQLENAYRGRIRDANGGASPRPSARSTGTRRPLTKPATRDRSSRRRARRSASRARSRFRRTGFAGTPSETRRCGARPRRWEGPSPPPRGVSKRLEASTGSTPTFASGCGHGAKPALRSHPRSIRGASGHRSGGQPGFSPLPGSWVCIRVCKEVLERRYTDGSVERERNAIRGTPEPGPHSAVHPPPAST